MASHTIDLDNLTFHEREDLMRRLSAEHMDSIRNLASTHLPDNNDWDVDNACALAPAIDGIWCQVWLYLRSDEILEYLVKETTE